MDNLSKFRIKIGKVVATVLYALIKDDWPQLMLTPPLGGFSWRPINVLVLNDLDRGSNWLLDVLAGKPRRQDNKLLDGYEVISGYNWHFKVKTIDISLQDNPGVTLIALLKAAIALQNEKQSEALRVCVISDRVEDESDLSSIVWACQCLKTLSGNDEQVLKVLTPGGCRKRISESRLTNQISIEFGHLSFDQLRTVGEELRISFVDLPAWIPLVGHKLLPAVPQDLYPHWAKAYLEHLDRLVNTNSHAVGPDDLFHHPDEPILAKLIAQLNIMICLSYNSIVGVYDTGLIKRISLITGLLEEVIIARVLAVFNGEKPTILKRGLTKFHLAQIFSQLQLELESISGNILTYMGKEYELVFDDELLVDLVEGVTRPITYLSGTCSQSKDSSTEWGLSSSLLVPAATLAFPKRVLLEGTVTDHTDLSSTDQGSVIGDTESVTSFGSVSAIDAIFSQINQVLGIESSSKPKRVKIETNRDSARLTGVNILDASSPGDLLIKLRAPCPYANYLSAELIERFESLGCFVVRVTYQPSNTRRYEIKNVLTELTEQELITGEFDDSDNENSDVETARALSARSVSPDPTISDCSAVLSASADLTVRSNVGSLIVLTEGAWLFTSNYNADPLTCHQVLLNLYEPTFQVPRDRVKVYRTWDVCATMRVAHHPRQNKTDGNHFIKSQLFMVDTTTLGQEMWTVMDVSSGKVFDVGARYFETLDYKVRKTER